MVMNEETIVLMTMLVSMLLGLRHRGGLGACVVGGVLGAGVFIFGIYFNLSNRAGGSIGFNDISLYWEDSETQFLIMLVIWVVVCTLLVLHSKWEKKMRYKKKRKKNVISDWLDWNDALRRRRNEEMERASKEIENPKVKKVVESLGRWKDETD